jgi:hypothetical protein
LLILLEIISHITPINPITAIIIDNTKRKGVITTIVIAKITKNIIK